jgi:hypothetical protein
VAKLVGDVERVPADRDEEAREGPPQAVRRQPRQRVPAGLDERRARVLGGRREVAAADVARALLARPLPRRLRCGQLRPGVGLRLPDPDPPGDEVEVPVAGAEIDVPPAEASASAMLRPAKASVARSGRAWPRLPRRLASSSPAASSRATHSAAEVRAEPLCAGTLIAGLPAARLPTGQHGQRRLTPYLARPSSLVRSSRTRRHASEEQERARGALRLGRELGGQARSRAPGRSLTHRGPERSVPGRLDTARSGSCGSLPLALRRVGVVPRRDGVLVVHDAAFAEAAAPDALTERTRHRLADQVVLPLRRRWEPCCAGRRAHLTESMQDAHHTSMPLIDLSCAADWGADGSPTQRATARPTARRRRPEGSTWRCRRRHRRAARA